jgi:integrase
VTVLQWLSDWLALRAADLRPRTVESYGDLIRRYIAPSIGAIPVDQLNPDQIRHVLAQICADGHSRTAELVFVMLKAAFADLEPCPMRKIKRPAHVQKSPEAWSDAEISIYMSAIRGHKHGHAFALGIVLGLRRGEICGLRWQDIDFDRGLIHIVNQRQRMGNGQIVDCPPKSASSVRVIPAPEALLHYLRPFRQLAGYVCPISPSGLDAAHRRLVHALGLRYIPLHGLRHSMATSCIRHGGSMRSLQALLGHANYATTANRYTHPDYEMLRNAIDCAAIPCYNVLH